MFNALDVVFSALSKAKRNQLLPAAPMKRGRKRTESEYAIGFVLTQALSAGLPWGDAVEAARRHLLARGMQMPDVDDSTLRRILDRYKRRDMRPRLLPRKIHP